MREHDLLRRIRAAYQEILGSALTGLYVHGSLALGCFCWERSDIDFLAVVKRPLTQAQKEALIRALLALDADGPPKGLEMSVVLESVCKPFQYPTPFELHFSNMHKQACRENLARYCRDMNGVDPDLAAHFTITRKAGLVLCGQPIEDVFGVVPRADYLDSILRDVTSAREDVAEQPASTVLNLCRVLACLREGAAISKRQGGGWALAYLPEAYRGVIETALRLYAGQNEPMNLEAARAFADYALEVIDRNAPRQ